MEIKNKTILIISPESWGKSFVSKHHYATLLAELGNQVYFMGSPNNELDQAIKLEAGPIPNLKLIHYKPNLRGVNRLPAFLRNIFNKKQIQRFQKAIDKPIDIVWSFDPFRFQNLKLFGKAIKIYHPVDIHATPLEAECAKTADILFSVVSKYLDLFPTNAPKYFVNHGLSEHFLENPINIDFQPETKGINIGYVGNIHYRYMDCPILKKIISQQPNCNFYFIGPYKGNNLSKAELNADLVAWLKEQPNAHLLGAKPPKELPAYLAQMDALLMCYTGDKDSLILANSHKILEYISTGKVTIAHYIDEYDKHRDLVEIVDKNNDLPDRFREVVEHIETYNSPEKQTLRRKFAAENSYKNQLKTIESYLSKHFS